MKCSLITIGDELLIGQVVNTNASWIAEQLNLVGIEVARILAVSDSATEITGAIEESLKFSDIIITTGGLGPTKDDVTKNTLAAYFNSPLVMREPTLKHVEAFFAARNRPLLEVNRRQAMVPAACEILPNKLGTAPGMWFKKNGKIIISLPGVPFEMKSLMTSEVLPRLQRLPGIRTIVHKTVITSGAGESFLAEMIRDWESELPPYMKLAYLPQPGIVRLRLTARNGDADKLISEIEEQFRRLHEIIPRNFVGFEPDTIESIVGNLLLSNQLKLGVAESCSGGYLSHLITSVPGSSAYFRGGIVAYSNDLKTRLLQVPESLIIQEGAVSQQVAEAMASGARKVLGCDFSLATTGIAGPSGGSKEKPVGTVWIALAFGDKVVSELHRFASNRERNIRMTAIAALNLLRKILVNQP